MSDLSDGEVGRISAGSAAIFGCSVNNCWRTERAHATVSLSFSVAHTDDAASIQLALNTTGLHHDYRFFFPTYNRRRLAVFSTAHTHARARYTCLVCIPTACFSGRTNTLLFCSWWLRSQQESDSVTHSVSGQRCLHTHAQICSLLVLLWRLLVAYTRRPTLPTDVNARCALRCSELSIFLIPWKERIYLLLCNKSCLIFGRFRKTDFAQDNCNETT